MVAQSRRSALNCTVMPQSGRPRRFLQHHAEDWRPFLMHPNGIRCRGSDRSPHQHQDTYIGTGPPRQSIAKNGESNGKNCELPVWFGRAAIFELPMMQERSCVSVHAELIIRSG